MNAKTLMLFFALCLCACRQEPNSRPGVEYRTFKWRGIARDDANAEIVWCPVLITSRMDSTYLNEIWSRTNWCGSADELLSSLGDWGWELAAVRGDDYIMRRTRKDGLIFSFTTVKYPPGK